MIKDKQPLVYQQLLNSYRHQRLSHSYLFEGAKGTGKEATALWFTQLLFCEQPGETGPCLSCSNCKRIGIGEHPDVLWIEPDGQTIKVDQIREIKSNFIKSGMESQRKVMVIRDADKMTVSAANSLLKFIEEPEGDMTILFLTESKAKILPTIQSRCQISHFSPLKSEDLIDLLETQGIGTAQAKFLAQLTNSFEKAVEFNEDEWFNEASLIARKWLELILMSNSFAFVFVQQELVKQCKEKEQQQAFFDMLLVMIRQQLVGKVTGGSQTVAKSKWSQKQLIGGIEEVLKARQLLDANVSFQNACEYLVIKLMTR